MDIFLLSEETDTTVSTVVGAFQRLGNAIDFAQNLSCRDLTFGITGPDNVYRADVTNTWRFEIARVAVMDA